MKIDCKITKTVQLQFILSLDTSDARIRFSYATCSVLSPSLPLWPARGVRSQCRLRISVVGRVPAFGRASFWRFAPTEIDPLDCSSARVSRVLFGLHSPEIRQRAARRSRGNCYVTATNIDFGIGVQITSHQKIQLLFTDSPVVSWEFFYPQFRDSRKERARQGLNASLLSVSILYNYLTEILTRLSSSRLRMDARRARSRRGCWQ